MGGKRKRSLQQVVRRRAEEWGGGSVNQEQTKKKRGSGRAQQGSGLGQSECEQTRVFGEAGGEKRVKGSKWRGEEG